MRIFSTLVFVTCLVSAAGCAEMNKQQLGTGIGAVIGGVAGSQVAGRSNRVVGVAAGVAVGAVIGSAIGKHLSEQDKKRAAEASTRTAQTGRPQQFRTSSGATVMTAPAPASAVAKPPPASSTPVQTAEASPECRTIRQTIVLQNGTREEEDVMMCNGPDGWQPA